MILVTGATGHLGGSIIQHLLKKIPADQIIALVRDEAKAATLKAAGVIIRVGDYHDAASLAAAFADVDKAVLISSNDLNGRFGQHKNVIDAAKAAGVGHLSYTGVSLQHLDTPASSGLLKDHFETEDYLKDSGIAFTLMRHNLYAEMIPFYIGKQMLEKGIVFPGGDGRVPFALRDEMGEANASVLISEGHENKVYNIANDTAWSFLDVADILSELAGKTITYTNIDPGSYIASLRAAGLPEHVVQIVAGFSTAMREGDFDLPSGELKDLLGRKPTDLKVYLRQAYFG